MDNVCVANLAYLNAHKIFLDFTLALDSSYNKHSKTLPRRYCIDSHLSIFEFECVDFENYLKTFADRKVKKLITYKLPKDAKVPESKLAEYITNIRNTPILCG